MVLGAHLSLEFDWRTIDLGVYCSEPHASFDRLAGQGVGAHEVLVVDYPDVLLRTPHHRLYAADRHHHVARVSAVRQLAYAAHELMGEASEGVGTEVAPVPRDELVSGEQPQNQLAVGREAEEAVDVLPSQPHLPEASDVPAALLSPEAQLPREPGDVHRLLPQSEEDPVPVLAGNLEEQLVEVFHVRHPLKTRP